MGIVECIGGKSGNLVW